MSKAEIALGFEKHFILDQLENI